MNVNDRRCAEHEYLVSAEWDVAWMHVMPPTNHKGLVTEPYLLEAYRNTILQAARNPVASWRSDSLLETSTILLENYPQDVLRQQIEDAVSSAVMHDVEEPDGAVPPAFAIEVPGVPPPAFPSHVETVVRGARALWDYAAYCAIRGVPTVVYMLDRVIQDPGSAA